MAADTRLRLILAAERLFGMHGIHAVSVRDIVEEAGQRNTSALNYHFGTREGLVAEVINLRRSWVDTERMQQLDELAAKGCIIELAHVAEALAAPLSRLMRDGADGANYILFLSQVFVSNHLAYAPAVRGRFDAGLRRCLEAYRTLRPDMAPRVARERFRLCGHAVVYALADWHRHTRGRGGAGQQTEFAAFETSLFGIASSILAAA